MFSCAYVVKRNFIFSLRSQASMLKILYAEDSLIKPLPRY